MENVSRIVNRYVGKCVITPDCTPDEVVFHIKRTCNQDAKYVGLGMVHIKIPHSEQHCVPRWGTVSTHMVLLEMIERGIRNELTIACLYLLNRAANEYIPDCNTFLALECTRTALGRNVPTPYTSSTHHVVDAIRPMNISDSSWRHIKQTNEQNIVNIIQYALDSTSWGPICRGSHVITDNIMHIHLKLRHGGAIYNTANCNQLRIIMQHMYREYIWHWHRIDAHTYISSMGNVDRYPRHPVMCVHEVSGYDIHEGTFSNGDVFIVPYFFEYVYKQLYPQMTVISYNKSETSDLSIYNNIYIRYNSFPRIPNTLARTTQQIVCFVPINVNISRVHTCFADIGMPCDTTNLSKQSTQTRTFNILRYKTPRQIIQTYIPPILLDRVIETCINSEGPEYVHIPEKICTNINPISSFTGDRDCPICLDTMKHVLLLNCTHCLCLNCYGNLMQNTCPLCRNTIDGYELFYALNASQKLMNGAVVQSLPRITNDALYDIVKEKCNVGRNLFITKKPMVYTNLAQNIPTLHTNHRSGGHTILLMSSVWVGVPLYKLYDTIYYIDVIVDNKMHQEIIRVFRDIVYLIPNFF